MYSGEARRERDIDFVLPVAKRQIIFSEEECLREGDFGFDPNIMNEESLKKIELIYFTRTKESVSQITDSYPIVEYYSENAGALNRFVERVTLAIVSGTKLRFNNKFTPETEIIDDEVVAYITNPFNVSTEIYYYDLIKLLYQKPELTVTNEGVLLFYTPTTVFATLDCCSGNIMGVEELAKAVSYDKIKRIKSIFVASDGTTIIKFTDVQGRTIHKEYHLSMIMDLFSECGVVVKISESED